MIEIDQQKVEHAFGDVATLLQGRVIRAWLASMLMQGPPSGAASCALHESAGRLNLAREMLSMLDASEAHDPSDVVIVRHPAVAGSDRRGAARRIAAG